jgi:protein tyrosine phosphatase (PTP) superfamily phosphohydrolase (DUF442 family)
VKEILNYIQMTEMIGTSGQPAREQFNHIAKAQYKSVVNLAMPDSDNAIADEGAVVSGLGMQYIHIPVPFDNPTANHLKSFIRIMRALEGEKVWVHCAVNARVSAFMYKYLRLEKGYDDVSAKNALLQNWEPKMDAVWKRFMQLATTDIA